jgi:predicted phage-related endonuclease
MSPVKDDPEYCKDSILVEGDQAGTEGDMVAFKEQSASIFKAIAQIVSSKKDLEEQEKKLKEQIKSAMEIHNVKSFNNDVLKLTYIAATTATTVDSKKLKDKHPAIYLECSKNSPKAAYVKIEVK